MLKERAESVGKGPAIVVVERHPGGGSLVDYLAVQRDALSHAYPGVRSGGADSVHDMRWIGDLLGAVRDSDVMAQRLADAIATEPTELIVGPVAARIRQRLAASGAPARAELAAALDSARLATLLETIGDRSDIQRLRAYAQRQRRLPGASAEIAVR